MAHTSVTDFMLTGFVTLPSILMWANRYELAVVTFFALIPLLGLCAWLEDLVEEENAAGKRDRAWKRGAGRRDRGS